MGRRRLVVFLSALSMLLIGGSIVGGLVAATQTESGRDWIRRQLVRQLARGIKGKLLIGRISGSFITDITIDTIQVTDPEDSVFIAFGRIHATYDPRDLLEGRIIIRSADVTSPFMVIRRENDDRRNFRKVFPPARHAVPTEPLARNAFGAVVLLHNVRVHGGNFQLTLPWQPDDSLRGTRRDSAAAVNMAVPANEIRRVVVKGRGGFQRTWRWTDWNVAFSRIRFRQPDTTGRQFDVVHLDVNETVPPFAFRNLRGGFYWVGDSIWATLSRFELPGSAGSARGKIDWADDRPIRYDVRVRGDAVALDDISWISSNLPRTGGGSMDLHIKSERDPHLIDYAITNMDARTNHSRLRGAMTYGVGGPVLIVKDVDLDLAPVDFEFLRTLNGGSFSYPWNGTLRGRIRARGGPANHFRVDNAALTFDDGNVPGATAAGVGTGEVDIVSPGYAKFHEFHVDLARFDLRTAQFVNHDFPRVNGTVSGTVMLDSIWTDVRFHDADLVHHDGEDSPPSRVKGSGRISLGDQNIDFDRALAAVPLSATTLAQSYPRFPVRGDYTGPLRVRGTVTDLGVTADLTGDAGRLQVEGVFNAFGPHYRAVAHGTLSGLDLRRALAREGAVESMLNGRFAVDLEGDSVENAFGTARLFADRSTVDRLRIHAGQAALRLDYGLLHVDSLRLETGAGAVAARGGIGLVRGRADSLEFTIVSDSLGGLRRYLASRSRRDSASTADSTSHADSLDGTLRVSGALGGTIARFGARATFTGAELRMNSTTVRALSGSVLVDGLPDSVSGIASARLDTIGVGSLVLSTVSARANLPGGGRAAATATAETPLGARAHAAAALLWRGDSVDVRLDTLTLAMPGDAWSLRRPATFTVADGGFALDSLAFAGARGAGLAIAGRAPADAPMALTVQADSLALADISAVIQTDSLAGIVTLHADVHGTRARPDLYFNGTLRNGSIAGVRIDLLTADGRYANRRLTTSLEYSPLGVRALDAEATLPIDLALAPAGSRWLEEPLSGRVRTDSVGLAVLEAFSRSISGVTGVFALDLALSGTWRHPLLTGAVRVRDGAFLLAPIGSVKLSGLDVDIGFLGDSIAVRRLAVRSGGPRGGVAAVTGFVSIRDVENPTFGLSLATQNFNAVNRARFADLDLTGTAELRGSTRSAVLRGSLTVDRGVIYVPELYQKRVISLDDPELYRVVDTTAFVERRFLPQAPPAIMNSLTVEDVPIQMGRDVWLRSAETNINLGGLVRITRRPATRGRNAGQVELALDGTLQTVRGTYRLNLGPVQRTFTVETGDVRFFGDPDLNPTLNINAVHVVRQFSQTVARPDVRVRVHIGGTLLSPTAELSSPDSLRVTNADLISYLVTGGPSYAITGPSGDYRSAAANVLLSSFGSVIGGKATGGVCDDAQLSTAGLEAYGRFRDVSANILQGTRFNCAKQMSDKVFVRVDAGLCQVGQLIGSSSGNDPVSFADAIGVKLDYHLTPNVTASVGMDPSTSAVLCTPAASARGFAPTPRQFGFDLFKYWRF